MSNEELKDLQHELCKICEWMEEKQYIPLKVFNGFWDKTDQRYLDYKAEYLVKHARKEELEALLGYVEE